ncbi:olfactory receptor 6C4-like [Alligator sinensis]|uniref:Olfactory receptor 6C4-like n=1 Tax=Alligator sinensis TaxID=38654 RepID=A0A1U7SC93_ALLSI|nr:olfactory receptor 6C4-like [Alligator sinensis]
MNRTAVEEFILLGLTSDRNLEMILFTVLLIIFLLILLGNLVVISITLVDHRLQAPMYFFLRNFSLVEISFTSTFMPRALYSLLTGSKGISLPGCFLQLLLFFYLGTCVFFHVAMMSFDRYVAICRPLHYSSLMNSRSCVQLVLGCWVAGLLLIFPPTIKIVQLPFCGPNVINHFYCDTAPLLELSCADTSFIEVMMLVAVVIILMGTLTATIFSYICIISTILCIPSSCRRKKAFSTCSSHLMVVIILYCSSIFRYIRPTQRGGQDFDKNVSFLYCVVTQLFNPYIYTLRNKQVKQALRDHWGRIFSEIGVVEVTRKAHNEHSSSLTSHQALHAVHPMGQK